MLWPVDSAVGVLTVCVVGKRNGLVM